MDWHSIKVLIGNYYGQGDIYIEKIVNSDLEYLQYSLGKNKIKAWEIGRKKSLVIMRNTMIALVKRIQGIKGAILIYSQWEGYVRDKEKAKVFWAFVKENNLNYQPIHTSGHATVDVLQQLKNVLNPGLIIPIHTENPKRFKEYFGKNVMIPSDGQIVEI